MNGTVEPSSSSPMTACMPFSGTLIVPAIWMRTGVESTIGSAMDLGTFHDDTAGSRLSSGALHTRVNLVGRTPRSARDAPVPLYSRRIKSSQFPKSRSGAGGPKRHPRGHPPHYLCRYAFVGKPCGITLTGCPLARL